MMHYLSRGVLLVLGGLAAAPLALGQPTPSLPSPPKPFRPEVWAAEIAAFARQDSLAPPPARPIVFVGSSSVRGWRTLATDFAGLPVLNRGFGGARLTDVNHYFDRVVTPYGPRQVVLYAGDNDIAAGYAPDHVFDSFRTFARHLRRTLPGTQLTYLSIKPSPARWAQYPVMQQANRRIRRYAHWHRRVEFVDVSTPLLGPNGRPNPAYYQGDSLHTTRPAYELWTKLVRPYLVK